MQAEARRLRAGDLRLAPPGRPGSRDAITDVEGVAVGHTTIVEGDDVRTGVTAVVPPGDVLREPVRAAVFAANGYGKLVGTTQIAELGEIETPILLTGTLSTFRVADALVSWVLAQPGNAGVRSVNPVVGETNDGGLSDGARRPVREDHVFAAISSASTGPVEAGCVGAGTGTVCLGYKGGIGSASRETDAGTVGVLVQTNFGGSLRVRGVDIGPSARAADGSCMIVVATDAALDARQLGRVARRAAFALANTGADFSPRSGDYAIAFSTQRSGSAAETALQPLFDAAMQAVEEAVLDSVFLARTTSGCGRTVHAVDLPSVVARAREAGIDASMPA